MKEFKGKVAVITGGASGIGRAIADRCIREDMRVVLADVEEGSLRQAETELKNAGGSVLAVRTDVSKRRDVEDLADKAFGTFGQVHLLFNNAGVAAGGSPWDATWNDWEWTMGVNLWGVIHGAKVFAPRMLEQNTECHIVNTSSAAGLIVGSGSAPYAVTKHAVVALSECMYISLLQKKAMVKVSVLCPGTVRTNIFNVERNRPPELRNPPAPLSPEMEAGRARFKAVMDAAMPSEEVAVRVFEAIEKEQFYILTHPAWTELIQLRMDHLLRMENPADPLPSVLRIIQQQEAGGRSRGLGRPE